MTDGNTAALNAHLAEQETLDYVDNWKEEFLTEKSDEAFHLLMTKGYFTNGTKGNVGGEYRFSIIDAICNESDNDFEQMASDCIKMVICGEDSSVYKNDIEYKLREALKSYFDADKAFENEHEQY
jgi:hypothetical protein